MLKTFLAFNTAEFDVRLIGNVGIALRECDLYLLSHGCCSYIALPKKVLQILTLKIMLNKRVIPNRIAECGNAKLLR